MPKLISQRDAYGKALLEEGRKNKRVCVVNADLSSPTKTKAFVEEFPERAFDVGIAEENGISIAAGLALGGLRPFFTSFAVFTSSNYDQSRMSIGYSKAPAVLVGTHAGLIGKDGGSHQALEDVNIMSALPGMSVFQPADPIETAEIVKYLANTNKMAYLRLSRHPQENVCSTNYRFAPGKASKLMTHDDPKAVLFSTGYLTTHAVEAARELLKGGIPCDVLNFSTLHPKGIDREAIAHYEGLPMITLEDHTPIGGLGSRVCEVIAEEGIHSRVLRLGLEGFGESGAPNDLYKKYGLDPESVVDKIKYELTKNNQYSYSQNGLK